MTRYVRVKPRKLRLLADLVYAAITSETYLLLVSAASIGLGVGYLIDQAFGGAR